MHDMSKETFLRPDQLKRGVEIELTQRPEWGTAFIRGRVQGKPQLWDISKSMDKRGRFIDEDELLQHWRTPNMSNTRKEIAARLGFAAGNGAKSSFGRAEDVYHLLETTPSSYNNAQKLDALATEAMRLADITPAGKDVSLHELAEMVGQDLEGDRSRASRPGAKAQFEISSYEQAEYQIALSEERIASYRKALANTEAMIRNANSLMRTADSGDKKAMKEVIGIARMLESTMKSRGFSRPGAKDEFGGMKGLGDWTVGFTDVMKERIAQLKQLAKSLKATVTLGRLSPNGMYSGTVNRRYGPMEPPDLMAPKKVEQLIKSLGGYENDNWRYNARAGTKTSMTREQTEEQKAGLKIMSAADPVVGAKIAKLIKEGKPQDQAVAIALDMKRRGEI